MTMRVILAVLNGDAGDEYALQGALAVARRVPAHIKALHVRSDPLDALAYIGPETVYVRDELVAAAEKEIEERAQHAAKSFETWRARHELALAGPPSASTSVTTALAVEGGDLPNALARHGRLADLIVVPSPFGARESLSVMAFEAALFESGRPVLLMPDGSRGDFLQNVLIAWKSSVEAARATEAALPILSGATKVGVFSATDNDIAPADTSELRDYLRWHGVEAEAVSFPERAPSVGNALLRAADRFGAGLLVMGAYTHTRLRELVFGGVTRYIVENTGLPVLLSH